LSLARLLQSNGKLERFHGSIKGECIRPGAPISFEDAVRIVTAYVEHYNHVRLHRAIGYIAPADKWAGREAEIFAARDRKDRRMNKWGTVPIFVRRKWDCPLRKCDRY
jgi:hypothetical protein